MNNAHDFFKNMKTLFEGKQKGCDDDGVPDTPAAMRKCAKDYDERTAGEAKASAKNAENYSKGNVRANRGDKAEQGPGSGKKTVKEGAGKVKTTPEEQAEYERERPKVQAKMKELTKTNREAKKQVKEGWSDENPDKDKSEWAEEQQCMADDKRKADKEDAACKAMDKKSKKPSNVKETASEFYRRYADIVNEAFDDEEDPDVAKADKVKGKDGKTQKDSEKNLPPWLKGKNSFEKKDKEAEDKGAKKVKKEKMESIQKEISNLEYVKAVKKINEAIETKAKK